MKKRILVVEDFDTIRNFLCEILTREGYDVIGDASMSEAWARISRDNDFQLLITDYNMPDNNGYDFLLRMKENQATRNIPVIFLTVESEEAKIKLAMDAGLAAWIVKPYHKDYFFRQVRQTIDTPPVTQ